jgi:hypothetical protein
LPGIQHDAPRWLEIAAVDKCYRPEPFHSDRERVEFLFALYEKLTAPLLPVTTKGRGKRKEPAPAEHARRERTRGLPGV